VLIIVCENTDIADVFFRNISGEREEESVTVEEVEEVTATMTARPTKQGRAAGARNQKNE
jgi:hypothetical protein